MQLCHTFSRLRALNSGDAPVYDVPTLLTIRGYTSAVSKTVGSVNGDTVLFVRNKSSIRMYYFGELLISKCK